MLMPTYHIEVLAGLQRPDDWTSPTIAFSGKVSDVECFTQRTLSRCNA